MNSTRLLDGSLHSLEFLISDVARLWGELRVGAILLIVSCILDSFAQWLEAGAGFSSTEAGLITLPMSACAAVASLAGARTRSIRTPFIISAVAAPWPGCRSACRWA